MMELYRKIRNLRKPWKLLKPGTGTLGTDGVTMYILHLLKAIIRGGRYDRYCILWSMSPPCPVLSVVQLMRRQQRISTDGQLPSRLVTLNPYLKWLHYTADKGNHKESQQTGSQLPH